MEHRAGEWLKGEAYGVLFHISKFIYLKSVATLITVMWPSGTIIRSPRRRRFDPISPRLELLAFILHPVKVLATSIDRMPPTWSIPKRFVVLVSLKESRS